MRYIFFGTPDFAATILESLSKAGMPPVALVCNPDRPQGRKKIITPPPTKTVASRYSPITILQPEKLDGSFLEKLKELNADFFVVAAYSKILKKDVLSIPPKGVIGVHPSLLPKYRGASPIQSAILNQEPKTGTALFMIDEKVDNGPVLAMKEINLENRNYKELEKELAELSADLLVETLPKFIRGEIKTVEQNHSLATFTKKFETKDGEVDYKDIVDAENSNPEVAAMIDAKIRALNPEPGAFTLLEGKRVKLLNSELRNNLLQLTEIQYEGKKPQAFNSKL